MTGPAELAEPGELAKPAELAEPAELTEPVNLHTLQYLFHINENEPNQTNGNTNQLIPS